MRAVSLFISVMIVWTMSFSIKEVVAEELVERSYDIQNIQEIDIKGGGEIEVSFGEQESLVLIGAKSYLDRVAVDAKGATLRIKHRGKHFWQSENFNIRAKLTLKRLQEVHLQGGMKVRFINGLVEDNLRLNLAGAVDVSFADVQVQKALAVYIAGASHLSIASFTGQELTTHASGASKIEIAGKTERQEAKLNGASKYFAKALTSKNTLVKANGASHIQVHVDNTLEVRLNGASHVEYWGSPKLDSSISGASTVKQVAADTSAE